MELFEEKLGHLISMLRKAELAVASLLFVSCLSLVTLTIVYRYILQRPAMWAPPLTTLLFTWMSMLGISYVYKERGHISVTFLADKLSPGVRRIVDVAILLIVLLFLGIVTYFSLQIIPIHARRFIVGLRLPRSYLSASVVFWGVSMILTTVYFLLREIRGFFVPVKPLKEEL